MILVRFVYIGWVLSGLLLAAMLGAFFRNERWRRATLPRKARRAMERLGPAFVKLGQALSQRRDLLGDEWTEELSGLQERVSPFPGDEARRIVELALKRPIEEIFASFDLEPLASASVAQVHCAQLKDGRDVVVKVLRPGVRAQIDKDMRILLLLMSVATSVVPALRKRQSIGVVREMWRNMRAETDLREEARNIRRFARAFRISKTIAVPDVIDGLSSSEVLVQELSGGLHIGDSSLKSQARRLAKAFIEFYLEQFFVVGLFHADPHPGNIFVMEDGRLCFHDFGAVGFLEAEGRQALMGFVQALIHEDADWLTQAASDLGLIAASADRRIVARGVAALLVELGGAPLREWSIATVMLAVARFGGGGAVILPAHLAALVRTAFTAEGTLRLLDPELDVIEMLGESRTSLVSDLAFGKSWRAGASARLKWEALLAVRAAPALAARAFGGLREGAGLGVKVRAPELLEAFERLRGAADRIAVALTAAGLYVASSLLMQHSIGPRVWGDLPSLAMIGYAVALWLTLRLILGGRRS